jgi:NitT/TauT family transport system ATP-binding protein
MIAIPETAPDQDPLFVEARELGVTFPGSVTALSGLNLAVQRGEFVSIVGPSGCGKSTLLRLIAGLGDRTEGDLRVAGIEPRLARKKLHDLAFVFQQPALLPWRNVIRNIMLPLELQRVPRRKAEEQAAKVLELVGLSEFHRMMPRQLSGGMKMRASVARALVTQPDMLLLDEPFGALDEITRQRLNEELLALWQSDRWTALFITHNVFEAVFLSQRVLVMSSRPGRIAGEIRIPLSYPRLPGVRATAEFAHLAGSVSEMLREHGHA